jgi:hypothetical protein
MTALNKENHIEIFPWNTNFETGISIIDEQHKKLIDLLNPTFRTPILNFWYFITN